VGKRVGGAMTTLRRRWVMRKGIEFRVRTCRVLEICSVFGFILG
jgi:hypothetical protein